MMKLRLRSLYPIIALVVGLTTACQVTPTPLASAPTAIPLPTMTPGVQVVGELAPVSAAEGLSPATAVAQVSRPTLTPDFNRCPREVRGMSLGNQPDTGDELSAALTQFLSTGGSFATLEEQLRDDWDILGDEGYIRNDADLTGEGQPEIVIGYTAPGDVGTLLVYVCVNDRYELAYQALSDSVAPPRLLWLDDVNNAAPKELLYATRRCDEADVCDFHTQLLAWEAERGRFVNLINGTLSSLEPPTLADTDDDRVGEIVIQQTNRGNSATGPLRTGTFIYDWNGSAYVLSLRQFDPPRYKIQVIHEADRAFSRLDMDLAFELYQLSLDGDGLRYWFNDGPEALRTYALYRMLLAAAYRGGTGLTEAAEAINAEVLAAGDASEDVANLTLEDLPVYLEMSYVFLQALNDDQDNLHQACDRVREVIDRRDEALNWLNRYGSRSPSYNPLDLCPY